MIEVGRACLLWVVLCLLTGQAVSAELWSRLRVVEDVHASFSPDQAWQQAMSSHALRLERPHQVVGGANSPPHWAAWRLSPAEIEQQEMWLSLKSPTQDHSALWVRHGNGPWQAQQELSMQVNGARKGYLWPTWALSHQGPEHMDVLLRIEGPNRVQFPLVMDSQVDYLFRQQGIMLFMGFVLAVPLVVMFFALTLIRSLQNPRLLLFLGMGLGELIAASWVSGLLNLMWPMLSRSHAAWIGSCGYWMLFVLSVFHAQSFLNTSQTSPKRHLQLTMLAWLWFCAVPLCAGLWPAWLRALLLWGGSLHAVFMLSLAWIHWRQQATWPRALYAGVWLVYASSVLVYWLYRVFEWPLFTTLGIQFVQGALVATLLGLSASLQVTGERRRLQEDQVLSRARVHWFAATQHDLWQPLQSIQLYVQALLKAPADQQAVLANGLQLASQSVDDFMRQLRYFAQGEWVSSKTPNCSEVMIRDVLQPLVDECRPLAQMRHLVLRYRPSDAVVRVDPQAVQRMVRNLLTNAMHYTPAGGRVLLACQKRGGVLWLLCIDNGLGMSSAQIDNSFQAFNAVDGSPAHAHKLGLGLFSVKQLALQHQMPMRLQSVQGQGTLVGFGMPLVDQPPEV